MENPFEDMSRLLQEMAEKYEEQNDRIRKLEKALADRKAMLDELPPVLSTNDVAKYMGVSYYHARQVMNSKNLQTFQVGGQKRVTRAEFMRWMEGGGERYPELKAM